MTEKKKGTRKSSKMAVSAEVTPDKAAAEPIMVAKTQVEAAQPNQAHRQTATPEMPSQNATSPEDVASAGAPPNIPPSSAPPATASRADWISKAIKFGLIGLAAILALMLLNMLTTYFMASSYIDKLAKVFDFNRHLASALALLLFVVMGYAGWYAMSFSGMRRRLGFGVLIAIMAGHSLLLWQGTKEQFFSRKGEAIKCYVVTRTAIKYGEQPGIDPATGLPCKPITPEIAERIREYERGRRPIELTGATPVFFDPRTGAPISWYAKDANGRIAMFDLMGFHPESGRELVPVTPEVVAAWREQRTATQQSAARRVPQRVDPERFGFFDPISGAARVWFWRSQTGEYEFFDAPGFHPLSGEALRIISPESISQWRSEVEQTRRKRTEAEQLQLQQQQAQARAIQETQEREIRERAERIERERAERAERERFAAIEAEKEARSSGLCDQLAANPTDRNRASSAPGVPFDALRLGRDDAIRACQAAIRTNPSELRYQYQLARAIQTASPRDAVPYFQKLVSQNYPAAYDNLGWLSIRLNNNIGEAARLFRAGIQLGDVDCLVSLAELVEKGHYEPRSPQESKWQLLARAASMGHQSAAMAVERERSRLQAEAAQRQQGDAAAQMMLNVFGNILGNMPRK